MANRPYWELLKDPRWQRKRLEVLESEDFTCQACGSADKTLHVHHRIYRKGHMPWEYGPDELACLCEDCHAAEHEARDRLADLIASLGTESLNKISAFIWGEFY